MSFTIKKAEKKQCKLRMTICGASGSGKTGSALLLARGIGGKTVVIDTERGSSNLYDKLHEFDVLELLPPHSPQRFMEAIAQCEKTGYEIIIVDSMSHAWAGEGGVLERVENYKTTGGKSDTWGGWGKVGTPEQNKLINKILQTNAHIICCLRAKTEWGEEERNGRKYKVKLGLAPVQRADLEYEFTLAFDMQHPAHLATVSKNRTNIFTENAEVGFLITEDTGKLIASWLDSGVQTPKPTEEQLMRESEILTYLKESPDLQTLNNYAAAFGEEVKDYPNYAEFRQKMIVVYSEVKKMLLLKPEVAQCAPL